MEVTQEFIDKLNNSEMGKNLLEIMKMSSFTICDFKTMLKDKPILVIRYIPEEMDILTELNVLVSDNNIILNLGNYELKQDEIEKIMRLYNIKCVFSSTRQMKQESDSTPDTMVDPKQKNIDELGGLTTIPHIATNVEELSTFEVKRRGKDKAVLYTGSEKIPLQLLKRLYKWGIKLTVQTPTVIDFSEQVCEELDNQENPKISISIENDPMEYSLAEISAVNEQIKQVLSGIPENANEYKKAEYIYDFVTSFVQYDHDVRRLVKNGKIPSEQRERFNLAYSLLGVFSRGTKFEGRDPKNVCQGYSLLYKVLAKEAGLDCRMIAGRTSTEQKHDTHAWNQIKVFGNWYNVDATWGAAEKTEKREYFLKSDEEFESHFPSYPMVDYKMFQHAGYAEFMKCETCEGDIGDIKIDTFKKKHTPSGTNIGRYTDMDETPEMDITPDMDETPDLDTTPFLYNTSYERKDEITKSIEKMKVGYSEISEVETSIIQKYEELRKKKENEKNGKEEFNKKNDGKFNGEVNDD